MDDPLPDIGPRLLGAGERLAERIGREQVASIVKQFVEGVTWQTWLKESGVELLEMARGRIDLGHEPDPETAALIADLLGVLMAVSMEVGFGPSPS
ncbi:hypothetical protein GCM10009530_20440 [Microbispora corallina]|uniref:Uncharacterized protein n=1 Tax=Microbispora corallina TaxID=83302 RepID=A0ABQ4FTZ4_9ACTN|nr:hypothetical protein [Microbispora corallina]GIH38296.1 hypothetical protein Mco01_12960 [Microbispora corallina]